MKPAEDEMFPEGAGPYVDLDEAVMNITFRTLDCEDKAGGSSGPLTGLAANGKVVHSGFFNGETQITWLLQISSTRSTTMTSGDHGIPASCVQFLSAVPVAQKSKGDGESIQERATRAAAQRRLIRNRRNISWYKQHSDFWGWYKYFTDNGNQEAVQEMDRIYLAYLQNKNRAEGRRSYKAYLQHLGEIYKSCSDTDDATKCVSSYTSRAKPEAPKPAPVKTCDPTKDPYCLYAALVQGKSPYLPLVLPVAASAPPHLPAKAPAPLYVRSPAPAKDPQSGYYYYSPVMQSFLSKEQKAELLRICAAEDSECLQYHLRAAYGYKPAAGPLPSYAHLGCDPKDPSCKLKLVQKAPSGLYMQYPNCDPLRDPRCAYAASLVAARAPNPPAAGPGSCNPLFEDNCNPLLATRFATPPEEYKNGHNEEAAAIRAAPPAAEQRQDPYAMFRDAYANANRARDSYAMYRQPNFEEPAQEERNPLGPPGKTKEGYDCFIGYDRDCYPVKPNEPRSGAHRHTAYPAEAYEPHVNADGTRRGVLEPTNPDCDPEYDSDCRLRRPEPEAHAEEQPENHAEEMHIQGAVEREQQHQEQYEADPYQSGQEEPYMGYPSLSQGMPSFQDLLRGYGDQFPDQGDPRAYADDYRKK
ncbi:actinodin1 [Lampris incognitus]|uniref:actinodin1 n=1 Tax=Lampris incognitus TaxID=2546036 RepID=UPI0024B5E084|nr:actinodin1 [Lampris incognitus]